MIGSQRRRAKTPTQKSVLLQPNRPEDIWCFIWNLRGILNTNWPRFFGWPIFSSKVTATNPTRPETHCVGREFSATGFKGTKKKHGLSSEWNEKTSQLRSLYSQTCFTYFLGGGISESLEIFKLNFTNFKKLGKTNLVQCSMGFFPGPFPF